MSEPNMVPVDNKNGDNDNNENNNMNNTNGGIDNTTGELNNTDVGADVEADGGAGGGVAVGAGVGADVAADGGVAAGGGVGADVAADGGVAVGGGVGADVEAEDSANTVSDNHEKALQNNQGPPTRKRKRYHRHNPFQIHGMEAFFRECPHPDDIQRRELGSQLGLDPLQIKFWFQNRRTQNRNHQERHENTELRTLNNKLKVDNQRYRAAMSQALCPKCGGQTAIGDMTFEEHHLRIQNARLKEEINQLSAMAGRLMGKPGMNNPVMPTPSHRPRIFEIGMGSTSSSGRDVYGNGGNIPRGTTGPADADKPIIIELAIGAMEELMVITQVDEPLWMGGVNGTGVTLNLDEYARTFRKGLGPRLSGYRTEASRETALVAMAPTTIVEMLMRENLWTTMFVGMIGRTTTHEQILMAEATGNFDGALQLMSAEYQVISPLVSTRESCFVRYSKQQGDDWWAVVDVSVDHLLPNIHLQCRRRPSGCLIQDLRNGYSKVTWVEHVEVDDRTGNHNIFKHLISTGQAFGANRWVATLERQCERMASLMATDFQSVDSAGHIALTNHGKGSILKLAERMARSFFNGMTNSMGTTFSGVAGDDIRVMTMTTLTDPGRPPGVVLSAATSFWVPVPPNIVFDFLRDETNRHQWDVLCSSGIVHKIAEIANGRDSRNCAALLRNANTNQNKMMIVQETSTDPTASFVIYAPVDTAAVEAVLNAGGDPDYVALLPSGFAILPDGMGQPGGNGGGSLLTVGFQMLVETTPSGKLSISSVATVENLIRTTVLRIKALFPYQNA